MFVADLEYWLNNDFNSPVIPHRYLIHEQNLIITDRPRNVSFSTVRDNQKRSSVHDLINERYSWRGYGSNHSIPVDRNHTIFVAEVDREVISTITLAIDSECGLAMDRTFPDVAQQFRQEAGTRICELTKLAFDGNIRSKEVLAGLFHLAFIYGTNASDCTDLFIEVNPRHVRFYEAMLGFSGLGSPRTNASVGASSQLMHLRVDAIRQNIREMAGKQGAAAGRSLYPYFFSPGDESRIHRALAIAHPPRSGSPALIDDRSSAPSREAGPPETSLPLGHEHAPTEKIMRQAA